MDKYCRLCWNSEGWRYPTGEAAKIESGNSYVAEKGFGHEEWLFNFEWILDGYRYGFLQPISKFRGKYQNDTFSVLLYTLTPEKQTLIVGRIDNLYVPNNRELNAAFRQIRDRGWLTQMIEDVQKVKGDSSPLENPPPYYIINVRFSPTDVVLFDPMLRVIDDNHKIVRVKRYQPFDWLEGDFPPTSLQPPTIEPDDPRRSENERTRAAQEGTKYNPIHIRLQNKLYESLIQQYGRNNVNYEHNFVDISVTESGVTTFYEIKVENAAKKCIRNSIGQLLEYAHYPNVSKADRFIIVGDAPPINDDSIYLQTIRDRYRLPISYGLFNWDTGRLDQII
jgi:hypothetical protein